MCANKDELKPHLHYPKEVRELAAVMAQLTGSTQSELLAVAVSTGISAMYDHLVMCASSSKDELDNTMFAKALSHRGIARQLVTRLHEARIPFIMDPVNAMRLVQEELPF